MTAFSELTYYKGLALIRLGRRQKVLRLFKAMKEWARQRKKEAAKIDYFATSLPTLLVFEEDLDQTKRRAMDNLIKLAEIGIRNGVKL